MMRTSRMLFLMNEFPVYNRGSRRLAPEARPFKATNAVLRSNSFRTSCGLSAFYLPFKCSQYQRRPINNGGGIMPLPCACARPPEPNKVHHRLISAFRSGRQAGRQKGGRRPIDRSMEFFPESPRAVDGRRHRLGRRRRRSRSRSNRLLSFVIKVEGRGGFLRVVELHRDGE